MYFSSYDWQVKYWKNICLVSRALNDRSNRNPRSENTETRWITETWERVNINKSFQDLCLRIGHWSCDSSRKSFSFESQELPFQRKSEESSIHLTALLPWSSLMISLLCNGSRKRVDNKGSKTIILTVMIRVFPLRTWRNVFFRNDLRYVTFKITTLFSRQDAICPHTHLIFSSVMLLFRRSTCILYYSSSNHITFIIYWSFVSSLLLYFLWLHLIVVSKTTGTCSCRVFQTTFFQLISSYNYTYSFFDDFVHELHKSVALLFPHSLSRKAVLGRMGISVLFRLGVRILDPVVMSAYEDRYDRTDEIRECDMNW